MTERVLLPKALRAWMDVSTHYSQRGWAHHAKATGLSMPQFSILMQLFYRGNSGISEISERFEITSAAASQHVDNLVQAGLIERTEDPRDRRAKQLGANMFVIYVRPWNVQFAVENSAPTLDEDGCLRPLRVSASWGRRSLP